MGLGWDCLRSGVCPVAGSDGDLVQDFGQVGGSFRGFWGGGEVNLW